MPGNVNRALPEHLDAEIDSRTWEVPAEFRALQRAGQVARDEMFRTFNMGVGMVVIAEPGLVNDVISSAAAAGVAGWRIGRVVAGSGRVHLT